jgi:dynein heavy chain, axonemal
MYKGLEAQIESRINEAVTKGDWIILEHLHLVEEWIPVLVELVEKWSKMPEMNPRFRLWITCIPN